MQVTSLEFKDWLLEAAHLAAERPDGPDTYIWDESNVPLWQGLFDAGLSPDEAVEQQFGYRH